MGPPSYERERERERERKREREREREGGVHVAPTENSTEKRGLP
jgi:hypothetical protein